VSAQNLSLMAKRLGRCGDINPLSGYVCVTQPHDKDVKHAAMFIGGELDGQILSEWWKMARPVRSALGKSRKGIKHTLTPGRAAQIHRWQMLGASAKRGRGKAQKAAHSAIRSKNRKDVLGTYASAAKWGVAKLVLPTSMVTPVIPGYQPGDRISGKRKKKRD